MNDVHVSQNAQPSSEQVGSCITEQEASWVQQLMRDMLHEQRLRRRWGIFFKMSALLLVLTAGYFWHAEQLGNVDHSAAHTALIDVEGEVGRDGPASPDAVLPALAQAYDAPGARAIILRINSPGGSPVQAGIVYDEIMRLRKVHPDKKLYVVVDEMCASGGYYIAAAADRIFVNRASIVGSIGVLMEGFGFSGLMNKLGVERRLQTAGENKGFLDPFLPQTEKQKTYSQQMLNEIHQQFITAVRAGRGARLKETADIFSGLFWVGTRAVELGLADDFGTVESVARNVVKAEDVVDYTAREGLPERVLKQFGASVGTSIGKVMLSASRPGVH